MSATLQTFFDQLSLSAQGEALRRLDAALQRHRRTSNGAPHGAERERQCRLVDAAAREIAPLALETAGHSVRGARLRKLEPISGSLTALRAEMTAARIAGALEPAPESHAMATVALAAAAARELSMQPAESHESRGPALYAALCVISALQSAPDAASRAPIWDAAIAAFEHAVDANGAGLASAAA